MVQGRLCVVRSTEDYLTVVLRETAAAAAPHLGGQDPRNVGLGGLRTSLSTLRFGAAEGEALLVVRSSSSSLRELL